MVVAERQFSQSLHLRACEKCAAPLAARLIRLPWRPSQPSVRLLQLGFFAANPATEFIMPGGDGKTPAS